MPLSSIDKSIFLKPYDQMSSNDEEAISKLCHLASKPEMKILEVGCWTGHSTAIFTDFAKCTKGMVYCVDTFKGNGIDFLEEYANKYDVKKELEENIASLGNSDYLKVVDMSSDEASMYLEDEYFDLIFIDADHRYNQIKKDIDNYFPKLKTGGIFAGHDFEQIPPFDLSTVSLEDLNRDMFNGYHCGVIKAVTERFDNYYKYGDRVWWVVK